MRPLLGLWTGISFDIFSGFVMVPRWLAPGQAIRSCTCTDVTQPTSWGAMYSSAWPQLRIWCRANTVHVCNIKHQWLEFSSALSWYKLPLIKFLWSGSNGYLCCVEIDSWMSLFTSLNKRAFSWMTPKLLNVFPRKMLHVNLNSEGWNFFSVVLP